MERAVCDTPRLESGKYTNLGRDYQAYVRRHKRRRTMTRLILATLAILAGLALIRLSLPKPRYITLSGHYQGRTWAKKIPA